MDRRMWSAVVERLAAAEEMATRASATLSAQLARRHIQTFAEGWRELLLQHQPDDTGRCPLCTGWLRRRRWPCGVWVAAHRHLVGEGAAPVGLTRNSNPFCRPREVKVVPRQIDVSAAERAAAGNASAQSNASKAAIHRT